MSRLIVDGGGTKTKAWLVESTSQTVVATASAGASNFGKVKAEGLAEVVRELKSALAADAKVERAVFGLAGVGRESEHAKALATIQTEFSETKCTLVTDAELAYRGAFRSGDHGILLIMGTGTIAFYRVPISHEFVRAGGWGPLLGDEGGGNWLGRELLRHCLREGEEDELSTLHAAILKQLNVESSSQLITKVYSEGFGPGQWAELAPLAFQFAHESPGAMRILTQAAIEVVELAERLAEQHLPEAHSIPLVVMGGLWERRDVLQPLLEQEIEIRNLPLVITEPVGGVLEGGLEIMKSNP